MSSVTAGHALGDEIEIAGLASLGTAERQFCAIGSVRVTATLMLQPAAGL
jgi:acyl transferase domain-containing protein